MAYFVPISDPGWSRIEVAILHRILIDGQVRRSKPEIRPGDRYDRLAAFVWRQLVFTISQKRSHQCMPVLCYYELPGDTDTQNVLAQALHQVVDRVLLFIPPEEWHGIRAWASLLPND